MKFNLRYSSRIKNIPLEDKNTLLEDKNIRLKYSRIKKSILRCRRRVSKTKSLSVYCTTTVKSIYFG